jgi:hypothetical protein
MLLKTLFIAILLYFAFRAVQNMLLAVREDARPPHIQHPSRPPMNRAPDPPHQPARPHHADVEDAKWEDL